MSKKRPLIDPIEGWKYGFPKELPLEFELHPNFDLVEWLIHEGFPEELTRASYFRYRIIG